RQHASGTGAEAGGVESAAQAWARSRCRGNGRVSGFAGRGVHHRAGLLRRWRADGAASPTRTPDLAKAPVTDGQCYKAKTPPRFGWTEPSICGDNLDIHCLPEHPEPLSANRAMLKELQTP